MSFLSKLLRKPSSPPPAVAPLDPIDAFWAWWREASVELAAAYAEGGAGLSDQQVNAISEHVDAIAEGLAWETGAGQHSQHHFALSAEGDAALRVVTQRWLARAPKPSKSWEYYAARQSSGPDARRTLRIDERELRYADFKLTAESDATRAVVHVVVYHPLFAEMSDEEQLQPTFLFLDDLLGEDGVTSWIGSVDRASKEPAGAEPPGALVEAVRQLREGWNDEIVSVLRGDRDGAPLIAMARLGVKRLDHLLHDHHLQLTLDIREPDENGFHSTDEGEELSAFEEGLIAELSHRAVWLGHETCAGKRIVHFHVDSSYATQEAIHRYCEAHGDWQTALSVEYDAEWAVLKRY